MCAVVTAKILEGHLYYVLEHTVYTTVYITDLKSAGEKRKLLEKGKFILSIVIIRTVHERQAEGCDVSLKSMDICII